MPAFAIGAVDLVAFIVALAVILILAAGWVFFRIIEDVLGHLPIIGGYIGNTISSWLSAAIKGVISTFDSLTHAVAHFFWAIAVAWWHVLSQVVRGIANATTAALNALQAAYAQAAAVLHEAQHLYNVLTTLIAATAADVLNTAMNAILGTLHAAEHLYNLAIAFATQVGADVLNKALDAITNVLHEAQHLYNLAIAAATALADDVRSEAVRLFGQAEADAAKAVAGVEAQVGALGAEITGVEGQLGTILKELGLVGLIPGLLTSVAAITAEVTTCLDPLCNTVTPNAKELGDLGNLISGLETLAEAGALAALLVSSVDDPAGTARVIVDGTGWLTDIGVQLVDAVGLAV